MKHWYNHQLSYDWQSLENNFIGQHRTLYYTCNNLHWVPSTTQRYDSSKFYLILLLSNQQIPCSSILCNMSYGLDQLYQNTIVLPINRQVNTFSKASPAISLRRVSFYNFSTNVEKRPYINVYCRWDLFENPTITRPTESLILSS